MFWNKKDINDNLKCLFNKFHYFSQVAFCPKAVLTQRSISLAREEKNGHLELTCKRRLSCGISADFSLASVSLN